MPLDQNNESVIPIDSSGTEFGVQDGLAIPANTPSLLIAGSDGGVSRIIQVDPTGAVAITGAISATNPSVGTNNAAIPTSSTQIGGSDGTNLQALRAFDLDSGGGTQYVLGGNLRRSAAGGSEELLGQTTMAKSLPVTIASDQTAIPISGSITPTADTTATGALGALNDTVTVACVGKQSVGFQLDAGTLVSSFVDIQTSVDGGTTWASAPHQVIVQAGASYGDVYTAGAGLTVASAAISGWILLPGGTTHARLLVGLYTSGTSNATLTATNVTGYRSEIDVSGSTGLGVWGVQLDGALGVGRPVVGGGQDAGGIIRTLLTETDGTLHVTPTTADTTATGALGALNATVTVACVGKQSVGFQFAAGTLNGTVVAEISVDGGVTWSIVDYQLVNSFLNSFGVVMSFAGGETTAGTVLLPGGVTHARLLVFTYTGGTSNVTITATNVTVDPLANLLAGGAGTGTIPVSGTLAVTQTTSPWVTTAVGTVAHDGAAAAVAPLLIGGFASAAAPANVSTTNDAVRAWFLLNGAQATVLTAAGALIGGDAANGLDVDVTRVGGDVTVIGKAAANAALAGNPVTIAVSDGTNAQIPRVFDVDTGGGTQYVLGSNLRRSAAGGSEELLGQTTMAKSLPIAIASDQTAIPISGSITPTADTTVTGTLGAPGDTVTVALVGKQSVSFQLVTGGTLDADLFTQVSFDGGVTWLSAPSQDIGTTYTTHFTISVSVGNPTPGGFIVGCGGATHARLFVTPTYFGGSSDAVLTASDVIPDLLGTQFAFGIAVGLPGLPISISQTISATVSGMAAHDAPVSGNPVLIAGKASAAAPANVSADGDVVDAWYLRSGAQAVQMTSGGVLVGNYSGLVSFGAPPTYAAQLGATDGTNLQAPLAFDLDSGIGSQYVLGVNLRQTNAGTSVELGTSAFPIIVGGFDGVINQVLRTDTSGRQLVVGAVAHDAVGTSVNPLLAGGYASAAAPANVSADGDAVRAWHLLNGAAATVLTAAGALIGGDAANGLDVDVTRLPTGMNPAALGQGTMAQGIRVVLPSDQSTIPVTISAIGSTGAAVPATAIQIGASDGTNLQAPRVFDLDSGGGTQYSLGVNLRRTGAGGSVELVGQTTLANSIPVAIASDQGTLTVGGVAAQDAPVSGNPVLIAGRASAAAPADVSADGDVVDAWHLRNGAAAAVLTAAGALIGGDAANGLDVDVTRVGGDVTVIGKAAANAALAGNPVTVGWSDGTNVQIPRVFDLDTGAGTQFGAGVNLRRTAAGGSEELLGQTTMAKSIPVTMANDQTDVTGTLANGAQTTVDNTAGGVSILASNANRKKMIIQNVGSANMRVGVTGVAATTGFRLVPGAIWEEEMPYCPTAAIFAIREGATNTTALAQEIT